MSEMAPIKYMGFYDVPRIFITHYAGETFLFDCPFDEELEDDSDTYKVYMLPSINDEDLPKDWTSLHTRATHYLGEVPVKSVHFDQTRRKSVDTSIIDQLTKQIIGVR